MFPRTRDSISLANRRITCCMILEGDNGLASNVAYPIVLYYMYIHRRTIVSQYVCGFRPFNRPQLYALQCFIYGAILCELG